MRITRVPFPLERYSRQERAFQKKLLDYNVLEKLLQLDRLRCRFRIRNSMLIFQRLEIFSKVPLIFLSFGNSPTLENALSCCSSLRQTSMMRLYSHISKVDSSLNACYFTINNQNHLRLFLQWLLLQPIPRSSSRLSSSFF
jgi:hypothetical protein